MQEVRDALAAILDNTSLSDMISRSAASEPILNYDI
jgi:DNA-binding IscR family transcriptional regulator